MIYIKKNYGLLFIYLISLLPLLNLLTPGLPITHDGLDHVARISSFYGSLSEGILIPRWAGNLNWGFGHPVVMFLYPLPSYFASFLHFIDISFVNSLKLIFAISFTLSGIFMYLWLSRFLSINAAILGSVLYLFAPYRFVDIYVRGAIGEHVAFVFLPLLLLSIILLFKNINTYKIKNLFIYFIFISFSTGLLILSHNGLSLLFLPFILFYIFYLFFNYKSKQNLAISISAIVYGFLLSFFFWFPAFFEGKYTLRNIVTKDVYLDRFVEFRDLLFGTWNYGGTGEFTTQLGFIQILLVISALLFLIKFIKSRNSQKYLLMASLLYLFTAIFFMLNSSKVFWEYITIIQKLQFPWRLLSISTFSISVIGAILIENLNIKNKNIIIIALIFITIFSTITYWRAGEYKIIQDNQFENSYPSTTDTGESSPLWSTRSIGNFSKSNLEIIVGNAEIIELERTSTYHEYVLNVSEKTRFRENTLYFPGWKIYDNENILVPEYQDPNNRGVMTFNLDEGLHNIIVVFENTKIRLYSNLITIISILLIVFLLILFILFPKTKFKKYKW